jgi:hypothetical protein
MAAASRLTNEIIDSASTTTKDLWLSDDDGGRGSGRLVVRSNSVGIRRFYFRYSIAGERKALALGEYTRKALPGLLTLAEARKIAVRYSALHRDPSTRDVRRHLSASEHRGREVQSAAPEAITAPEAPSHTLLDLCNLYADGLTKRKAQSASLTKNCIKNHIAPTRWAACCARDIKSEDIANLLRPVVEAGTGTTAIKVRRLMHAAYAQAMKASLNANAPAGMVEFGVVFNPVSATASLTELTKTLDRALNSVELGHFWKELASSSEDISLPTRFVRLSTLLGGQRALQLLRCTTNSVDLDEGSITLLDGKGRRPQPRIHALPLTPGARAEVKWLLQHSKNLGCHYLFAGRSPDKPMTAGPASKAVRVISKKLVAAGLFKAPFRYADLRRTIETRMASLSIHSDVRAQILSHGLGGVQSRHYDRSDYREQKLDALVKWEAFLAECKVAAAGP